MKHIAAVAALLFACSSLCADSPLTGVHKVCIAGNNLAVKHDITRALRSELPQVRVVSRPAEADRLRGAPSPFFATANR